MNNSIKRKNFTLLFSPNECDNFIKNAVTLIFESN